MQMTPGVIRGISELALWVTDLERAVAFYRDRLGFAGEEVEAGHYAFLKSGGLVLGLFLPSDPGTPLAREYLARTGGPRGDVYHVGFLVEGKDLDGLATALREQGQEVRGPVEFATGRRSYFLEDPDAHYIELTDQ